MSNTINVLITDSDAFSWYKKRVGEKIEVFENKISRHGLEVYHVFDDDDAFIMTKHCKTKEQQRSKKYRRLSIK